MHADTRRRNVDSDEPDADPESVARAICLRLLADRPRTRSQLADALAARRVPAAAAEAVLDRLTEVGLLDDAAFAEAWVATRQRGRGLARRALREELRQRGIDPALREEALAQVDDEDELTAARTLVARRLPSLLRLPPEVRHRRLFGLLTRKGYPAGVAQQVCREAGAGQLGAAAGDASLQADHVASRSAQRETRGFDA